MLKKRIIPVILLRNGQIVQSRNFKRYQILGTPTSAVQRLSSWFSDELIYLDISKNAYYDLNRNDLNHPQCTSITSIIELVSQKCFMPLTLGGGIRNSEDVRVRIRLGADKIAINTIAVETPLLISEFAKEFGSQCIVVSVDVKRDQNGRAYVCKNGKEITQYNPVDFVRKVAELGAGEILLNSVDRDGTGVGFDIDLIKEVSDSVRIPVIALGGAGKWSDFEDVLKNTNVSAVAAANIFHHSENSVYAIKKYLFDLNFLVRKPIKLAEHNANL